MQGSKFPSGVVIDTVALRRTETSKAAEILRGRVDWTSRGMLQGGEITINAVDDTKIDVAQLSGFTPSGEYIATVSDYFSIALNDYGLGVSNLLVAVYTENDTYKQPHETDGTTYATYAQAAYRIRVYSEANFAALPATDANLGNDAQDRCLLIAKITGNGIGVALTLSNVTESSPYDSILYATPLVPPTIAGVTILNVSVGTSVGDGLLEFYLTGGGNTYLRWGSSVSAWVPGAVPPGNGWVEITADSTVNLPDPSGEYIRVQTIYSELPTGPVMPPGLPLFDAITITNLYYQEVPRLTAEDFLHRSMLGTGTPTPTNPHGLTVNDLSGSTLALLDEHQDLMHSNGIWKGSSASCMECTVSFPVAADQLNITAPGATDLYYINGKKLSSCAPLSFLFLPAVVPSSASGCHFYEISVSDEEVSAVNLKMSFPNLPGRTLPGTWIVGASEDYAAGSYDLELTVAVPGVTTYTFSWDGGETVQVTSAMDSQVIRLYAEDSESWIDLLVNTNDAGVDPDATLPIIAGVYTDSITVYVSPDWSQNLHLASLCGWWNATGGPARFQIGYKPYDPVRSVVDTREWGTLSLDNMSDSALQELAYSPQDELHYSGVLYRRHTNTADFEIYGTVGLATNVRGGAYYCRGQRIEFAGSSTTLTNNVINLLYLDHSGNLQLIDVTTDFAGVIADAVEYVVGGIKLTPYNSEVYHATDLIDPPERGVALYAITTAAGVITVTTNVMRNVNGPVDPWSVGYFGIIGGAYYLSAFDSLYTAFMYASFLDLAGTKLDITLVGPSYISEVITQPLNVNVRGKVNSVTTNVTINVADAAGAWRLSLGCGIWGASIYLGVDGGAAVALNSSCTIDGCGYSNAAFNTNDIFLYAGAAYNTVHIRNNKVATHKSFISATASANTEDWWIENNNITQSPSSVSVSVIDLQGKNLHVTRNHIRTDNSTSFVGAIGVDARGECFISENTVEVGSGDQTFYDLAISVSGNGYAPKIFNNIIKRESGATSHTGIGIFVSNGSPKIQGNTITEMGGGILVVSDIFSGVDISCNTLESCYHFGVDVIPASAFTSVSGVSITSNTCKSMVKNAGGAALGYFGNHLYGIYFNGIIASSVNCGGVQISNNTVASLSNAISGTAGIDVRAWFTAGAGIVAGWEGVSVDSNTIMGLTSSTNNAQGVAFSSYAAAGVASTLTVKGISISGNKLIEMIALSGDAHGINSLFAIDAGHTSLLNGFNVNNNSVSGFYGQNVAAGIGSGITLADTGPLDYVFGMSCSCNTVGTVSNNTVGAGTDNDATNVCGIYSSLKSGVISNNAITIIGSGGTLLTARGDGIRAFSYGTPSSTVGTVISNNRIQVNWAGIHVKTTHAFVNGTFEISNNHINSGCVGVYLDEMFIYSVVSGNTVYVAANNSWEDAGCTLDGVGGIVAKDLAGSKLNIIGNIVTLAGSAATYSANIWAYHVTNISIGGNFTYKTGAVVNNVYHIYVYRGLMGCSVIGNTVDNTGVGGAHGIYVDNAAGGDALIAVKSNSVVTENQTAVGVYEYYVATAASDVNFAHIHNNSAHLLNDGVGEYPLVSTGVGGHGSVQFADDDALATWVYTNVSTHDSDGLRHFW